MDNTISLCMIVRNSARFINTVLKSARNSVDEIIVVDTGSTDDTKNICLKYGAKIYDFVWIDDFAAARNYGIEQANMDWILILDEDDELLLTNGLSLKDDIARFPQDLVFRMNIVSEGKSERPNIRIWKNGFDLHYMRPIHETHDFANSRMNIDTSLIRTLNTKVAHHHATKSKSSRSERNFRLLSDAVRQYPDDHASYYYLGTEYNVRREPHKAISCFLKVMSQLRKQDREQLYRSRFSIAPYAYANLIATLGLVGDLKQALFLFDEAIQIFPDFRELHYLAGIINMELNDHQQAIKHFSNSLKKALNSGDYLEETEVDVRALSGSGDAYVSLGRFDEAKKAYFEALQKSPNDEKTQKNLIHLLARGSDKDNVIAQIKDELTEIPPSMRRNVDRFFPERTE